MAANAHRARRGDAPASRPSPPTPPLPLIAPPSPPPPPSRVVGRHTVGTAREAGRPGDWGGGAAATGTPPPPAERSAAGNALPQGSFACACHGHRVAGAWRSVTTMPGARSYRAGRDKKGTMLSRLADHLWQVTPDGSALRATHTPRRRPGRAAGRDAGMAAPLRGRGAEPWQGPGADAPLESVRRGAPVRNRLSYCLGFRLWRRSETGC